MKNSALLSENKAKEIVDKVLSDSLKQGASSAEVSLVAGKGFQLGVRAKKIETLEFLHDTDLSLTIYCGQRSGTVSTSNLNSASLQEAVKKAISIASYIEEDPFAGLPDAKLMANKLIDCDLYHPWEITPNQAAELSIACEDVACQQAGITQCEEVSFNTSLAQVVYGNTRGFVGSYRESSHSLVCSLIAGKDSEMQRDYDYTVARDHLDLLNVKSLALNAAKKTKDRLGARKVKTQKCPVVFLAPQAKGLLGSFLSAISGGNLYRKTSFLLDSLDKKIFPDFFNLVQKPHIAKGMGSLPFDSEGVATTDRVFVENGVLRSYLLSSYGGRRLGLSTTGNCGGVQNLLVGHSDIDLFELLKKMGTGVLVTGLMGQGVNLTTGDYSRGAHGFWVENGEIVYPVEEITVAGNLADMFSQIVCVANDVDRRSRVQSGSILLESMMVAGS